MMIIVGAILYTLFVTSITVLSFHLGERKTEKPTATAVIGFLLCLLPPFALIYVVILALKEDVASAK